MNQAWLVMVAVVAAAQVKEVLLLQEEEEEAGLRLGFYDNRCPVAEEVVSQLVQKAARRDPTIPPALLRLHHHDCFVQGCDGSILLDRALGYPPPEKLAEPNWTLRGFWVVDWIKRALEALCPSTVSCADILALSARDAVTLAGGPRWEVRTGRRDGQLSSALLAAITLPQPHFSATQLKQNFLWHGLSEEDLITLSGAHTIGSAHCLTFWKRLYHHNSTTETDPSLNHTYAAQLKRVCPRRNRNPGKMVPLDPVTPWKFDNMYYKNLEMGIGLLASDQVINGNNISELSRNLSEWEKRFTEAMIHLGELDVKIGSQGEIRRNCRRRN